MGHKEEILGRLNEAFREALLWGYMPDSVVMTGDLAMDIECALDMASEAGYSEGFDAGYEDGVKERLGDQDEL
jgi:hypothetical protein